MGPALMRTRDRLRVAALGFAFALGAIAYLQFLPAFLRWGERLGW